MTLRRAGFALLFTLLAVLAAPVSRAQDAAGFPIVPLRVYFTHWDHHWFVWLPRHPVYEAVEIHSEDRPGGKPLVWVYFTERAAPKRQTNYVNDEGVARATGWIYRDIQYTVFNLDTPERPAGVAVDLDDRDDLPVVISVEFEPARKLTAPPAGAGDQLGRGAERAFLAFYRATGAATPLSLVTIDDGPDLSEPIEEDPHPAPFRAAYIRDTFNAALLFMRRASSFKPPVGETPPAATDFFAEVDSLDPPLRVYLARQDDEAQAELITDEDGALRKFISRRGIHWTRIAFDPPLPPLGQAVSGASTFSLGFDDMPDLVSGSVAFERQGVNLRLTWSPETPDWTRMYPFQSLLTQQPDDGQVLSVSTLRGSIPLTP